VTEPTAAGRSFWAGRPHVAPLACLTPATIRSRGSAASPAAPAVELGPHFRSETLPPPWSRQASHEDPIAWCSRGPDVLLGPRAWSRLAILVWTSLVPPAARCGSRNCSTTLHRFPLSALEIRTCKRYRVHSGARDVCRGLFSGWSRQQGGATEIWGGRHRLRQGACRHWAAAPGDGVERYRVPLEGPSKGRPRPRSTSSSSPSSSARSAPSQPDGGAADEGLPQPGAGFLPPQTRCRSTPTRRWRRRRRWLRTSRANSGRCTTSCLPTSRP